MHSTDQPKYACETSKLHHVHILKSAGELLGPVTESERQCRFCKGRVEVGDQRHIHTRCDGLPGVVEARRLSRIHVNQVAEELNNASGGELHDALTAALGLDNKIEKLRAESAEFGQLASDYRWLPRMQILMPDMDSADGVVRPGDEFPRHAWYRGIVTDTLAEAVMGVERKVRVKAEAEAEKDGCLLRWRPTLLPAIGAAAWAIHRAAELELRSRLGVAVDKVKHALKTHEAAAAAALEDTGEVPNKLQDVVQVMQKAIAQSHRSNGKGKPTARQKAGRRWPD